MRLTNRLLSFTLSYLITAPVSALLAQGPVQPFMGRDMYPTLHMAKDVELTARYDEDHRMLYEARNWKVVMVDSSTLAIVQIWGREPEIVDLDPIWTFKHPTNHHFTFKILGWGRFEIYSKSVLTFHPISAVNSSNELTFSGDADIHIYDRMVMTTPNYFIQSIWPSPTPNVGALISVKDFQNDSSPGIAAYPNEVAVYGNKSNPLYLMNEALKKRLNARVNDFYDHFLEAEGFGLNDKTAPQILDMLVRFYGIKGYVLDPKIDTTEKPCLMGGALSQSVGLDEILSAMESIYFHYDFHHDVIMVYALEPYLRHRREMAKKNK